MPIKSSLSTWKLIKFGFYRTVMIPIIALTADVTTVDLEKCKAAGMNDYVSKPLDERILYAKMIDLLKQ